MYPSITVRTAAHGHFSFSAVMARALLLLLTALAPSAWAGSSSVVISQYYVNGGSSGATYTNKYVELFNLSNAPVSINGWSLQYGAPTGTTWSGKATLPDATLQPGQRFLVQMASNGTGGVALSNPDATTTLNPGAAGGKIALVNSTTTLAATACPPTDGSVIDFVGWGTANCSEPIAAPATTNNAPVLSVTLAGFRAGSGCTDTDNNKADFSTGAPNPRNSSATWTPCGGSSNPVVASKSAAPSSVAAGDSTLLSVTVTPGANPASSGLTVSVDLTLIGGSSSFPLYDDGAHGDGAGGDNVFANTAVLGNSVATGSYSFPITVTDTQNRTAAATSISLNVIPPPAQYSIMEIQGHGSRSSLAGAGTTLGTTYVITPSSGHNNIVTAVGPKGFFMQDTVGDGDVTTSDGIYVYLGVAPSVVVGDLVNVTGRIQEFSGSTEIAGGPSYTIVGHDDNSIPASYDLTANLPSTDPTTGICLGAGSTIQPPSADGLTRNDGYQAANFACLDGMLVTMSHGIVNAPTYTTANSGITPSPITPNSGFFAVAGGTRSFRKAGILGSDANRTASIPTFWGNPELIQVYFPGLGVAPASLPQAANQQAGGIYDGGQEISLTGVIQGYQAAGSPDPTYELYPRSSSDLQLLGTLPYPVAVPDPIPGKLRVGTQNMLHFFNASYDGVDTSVYTDRCLAPPADVTGNLSGLNTPLASGGDDTCPTPTQYQTRLTKMSLQIRTVLKAPVVQVVQEAENLTAMRDLAAQIQADDSSIVYQPYLFKGNDPGGINIGIFTRAGVTVNSVTQMYLGTTTTACSGGGTCLLNDRPPVLLDASYQGYHFRVLAIYDRSLSSLGAAGKDYVGQKRRAQAEQVACILSALQTTGTAVDCDPAAPGTNAGNAQQDASGNVTADSFAVTGDASVPVIVLGDFNAYEFSDGYVDVAGTIMGTVDTDQTHSVYPPTANYVAPNPVLFDTGSVVPQAQHYSYNFGGLLQEIDHILLTDVGRGDFVSVDGGRGNSDVSIASLTLTNSGTPMRTSDHDGQVVTLGWVLTPSAGSGGSISPATMRTVSSSTPAVFTVTPDGNNQASVTDTCGSGGAAAGSFDSATNTYTIPAGVSSDCSVTATFDLPAYAVMVNGGAGGTVTGPAQSPVTQGQSTTFTVDPLTGYSIASVVGDTCAPSLQSGITWTTGTITAACTITVTFSANPVNGVCGADNGQTLSSAPINLCTSGAATSLVGSGPWTWTCQGSNGGTTATCSANAKSGSIAVLGVANGDTSPSTTDGTDFGSVNVGSTASHGFTISNAGASQPTGIGQSSLAGSLGGSSRILALGDLTIGSITSSNPAFTITGGTGTIASGGSATFTVTFHATAAGVQNATVTINSNDLTTPTYTFAVTALAVAVPQGATVAAPVLDAKSMLLLAGVLAALGHLMLRRRKSTK